MGPVRPNREPPAPTPSPESLRDVLLVALTFAAGVVDAVSFLGMGEIFTANMTGNVVFLALAVGQGSLFQALRSVDALLGFSLGAILAGRLLGAHDTPNPWSRRVTWIFAGELAAMTVFALGWALLGGRPTGDLLYLLIATSAVGMGLQNAAARDLRVPGLSTTVLTTALTGFMAEFAALGISGPTQKRAGVAVLALFSGAATGAALLLSERSLPPFATVGVLAAVVAIAYARFDSAPVRERATP